MIHWIPKFSTIFIYLSNGTCWSRWRWLKYPVLSRYLSWWLTIFWRGCSTVRRHSSWWIIIMNPRKLDVPSLLDFFVLKLRSWHLEQKKAHLKTCYTPAKTPTVLFSRTYAGWCGLMWVKIVTCQQLHFLWWVNHNEVWGWKRSNVQVCNEMLIESIVKVFVFFFVWCTFWRCFHWCLPIFFQGAWFRSANPRGRGSNVSTKWLGWFSSIHACNRQLFKRHYIIFRYI